MNTIILPSILVASVGMSGMAMPPGKVYPLHATQQPVRIVSFEQCVVAGHPVLRSLPPQCITPDGQRFTLMTHQQYIQPVPPVGHQFHPRHQATRPSFYAQRSRAIGRVHAEVVRYERTDPRAVRITSVAPRTWPNACLGLPKADEFCAEVLTHGYRIEAQTRSATYVYRTNIDGSVVRRESVERHRSERSSGADVQDAVMIVRKLTAEKERIPVDHVRVLQVERRTWPDGCLGLAKPDEACTLALVNGYRITVHASWSTYTFRTDQNGSNVRVEQ